MPPSTASSDWAGIGWPGAAMAGVFALVLCLPFRAYVHALLAARARVSARLVLGLTALLAGIPTLMYPRFGSDVFDYLGFERMWVVYGDNPLLGLPRRAPGRLERAVRLVP